ncbi:MULTISPECIES: DUF6232 family protein [unclassified Streptomyces]|uniref:DUF6232 family protein n=1 Tax=unclassified Streptomyces TaxID=2593676 RepID=UPI002258205B|nr:MULTISPECIES: DUF6232 family protein [unclassified Streptomyces]MCX5332296.1 DUF6232 family protein [Streptomyces sp. NBC_00140]MCX5361673.1 DUF6232 family protein [Streptomyces sp. NBC_00124]
MERTEPPGHHDIPPPPLAPPQALRGIDLRVGKHLLWVGGAAYPLANITRVYTFMLTPRRKDATVLFLKRVAIILSVAFTMTILGGLTSLASESMAGGILTFVWLGAIAALVFSLVELVAVLSSPTLYVLAVETSGPSIAMVTSSDPHQLDQLVGSIVHAIEHPETEFHVTVDRLMVNPRNYYFGDNVNMYGGTGNVGVANR